MATPESAPGKPGAMSMREILAAARLRPVKARAELDQGDQVNVLAFSPDGKSLAVGCGTSNPRREEPGFVNLWDVASGKRLARLDGDSAVGTGFEVVDKVGERKYLENLGHPELVDGLAFSPDGKTLASGGDRRTLIVWDLVTRKRRLEFCGYRSYGDFCKGYGGLDDCVGDLHFSPDGRALATMDDENLVRVWDVASARQLAPLTLGKDLWISGVVFESRSGILLPAHELTHKYPEPAETAWLLWDVAAGKPRWRRKLERHLGLAGTSAGGKRMIFLASDGSGTDVGDGTVLILDAATGRELATFRAQHQARRQGRAQCAAISPDGKRVVLGSWPSDKDGGGAVSLWDVESRKELAAFLAHPHAVMTIAFSPDGKILATSGLGDETKVKLWDVETVLATEPLK